jgi:alkaline phosphatase
MSFIRMVRTFNALKKAERKPKVLQKLVNENMAVKISREQAKEILKTRKNQYYDPTHKTLKKKRIPAIRALEESYYDTENTQAAMIGQAVAPRQSIVWATGGHTATPVIVLSYGPKPAMRKFKGYLTHTKIGQLLKEMIAP